MVAGIAALLKSFDPTLTPESIKGLIVQGAAVGNRPILNHPGRFVVNAYSSLKLAGQKPGTPLCGNRIWLEGRSSLQVLRGATTETLDAVTDTAWAVAPEHGGRRVVRLKDEWHAYFNRPSNFLHTISFREGWFQNFKKKDRPVP